MIYTRYLVAFTLPEFRAVIEKALRVRGVSAIRAARSVGLNRDAIRAVLRGRSPSFERVAEICDALHLEFHIGLPRGSVRSEERLAEEPGRQAPGGPDEALPEEQIAPAAEPPPIPLTRFTSRMLLPVHDFVACSPQGHFSHARGPDPAPAPIDLQDWHAFYVRMPGQSMVQAAIWSGDYCLVSPCARLQANQRAWFRHREGQETIKWLVRLTPRSYELVGWNPPDEEGHQRTVVEQWMRTDVVDRGVVLAVYRGRPSVQRPPFRTADWRPEQVVSLQRGLDDDSQAR